jgi:hypothetical protein
LSKSRPVARGQRSSDLPSHPRLKRAGHLARCATLGHRPLARRRSPTSGLRRLGLGACLYHRCQPSHRQAAHPGPDAPSASRLPRLPANTSRVRAHFPHDSTMSMSALIALARPAAHRPLPARTTIDPSRKKSLTLLSSRHRNRAPSRKRRGKRAARPPQLTQVRASVARLTSGTRRHSLGFPKPSRWKHPLNNGTAGHDGESGEIEFDEPRGDK